jgi:endonuclease YncB( thermonuclease family)
MLNKLFYLLIIFCLSANVSLSQKTEDTTPVSANKQKVVGTAAANRIDEIYLLIEGKVKIIDDGDTISVETKDGNLYTVRMQGIDAPEEKQDYGEKSKKKLRDLTLGKAVTVVVRKKDSLNRYIGTVYVGGQDINLKQIEAGLAWHFKKYGYEQTEENQKIYEQAEKKARTERSGLWKDKSPVEPSVFRGDPETAEIEKQESAEKPVAPTSSNSTTNNTNPTPAASSNKSPNRTYIQGSRGGCYYINSKGNKTYVDRSLCN